MIPRIIHQIWQGSPVPSIWAGLAKSWQRLHPEWGYRLWTDADSRPFVEGQYPEFLGVYDSYAYPIQRADALRYLLLHHFGGVYVDMDIECLRPIGELLAAQRAVVVPEPSAHAIERGEASYLSNAFFAAEPGHPALSALIRVLANDSAVAVTHRDVSEMTGPHRFDRVCQAIGPKDVCVLDSGVVFPLKREAPELRRILESSADALRLKRSCMSHGAYAIHYWANSWYNLRGEDLCNPDPHGVDGFVFFPGRDSVGYDIRNAGRNVRELARACLASDAAVAFNTDGFLKSRVRPKRQWDRWRNRAENEGLYIRQSLLRGPLWPFLGVGR
jgi:hypothetical protein